MQKNERPTIADTTASNLELVLGGRGLQIAGLISIFAAIAFFLKIAIDHQWIPPLARVVASAISGIVLLAAGARARRSDAGARAVADGLAALGASLLYLSAWAAGPLFDLVPTGVAFAAMSLTTGVLATLAARSRSQVMAIYGLAGGFITPALLPLALTDHLLLAGYLLALCAGMLRVAEQARFRFVAPLAFIGGLAYAGQFAIDPEGGWSYVHDLAVATAFFVEFGVALFVATRRRQSIDQLDIVLTIANLVAYLGMLQLVAGEHHLVHAGALTALAAVLGVAAIRGSDATPLRRSYGFAAWATATMIVPTVFDWHGWSCAAAFAAEGMLAYGFGSRYESSTIRRIGLAFTLVALSFTVATVLPFANGTAVLSAPLAAAVLLVISLAAIAVTAGERGYVDGDPEAFVAPIATVAAFALILTTIAEEAMRTSMPFPLGTDMRNAIVSLSWTLTAAFGFGLGLKRKSAVLRRASLAVVGITMVKIPLVDLSTTDLTYRVAVLLALGIVSLIVSAAYLRGRAIRPESALAESVA